MTDATVPRGELASGLSDAGDGLAETQPRPQGVHDGQPGQAESAPRDTDFSIEQYMADLLRRYGADVSSAEETCGEAGRTGLDKTPDDSNRHHAGSEDEEEGTEAGWTPSAPPERRDDLEVLRGVANRMARSAVHCHLGKQLVRHTYTKLTMAIMTGIASFGCVLGARLDSRFFLIAVGTAAASLFWTGQFLSLTRQLHHIVRFLEETPERDELESAS